MLKLSTTDITELIDAVLAKHQWTQSRLAQEMNLGPETISRWKSGTGIHKGHHEELKRLAKDQEQQMPKITLAQAPGKPPSIRLPFAVTVPKESIKITMDGNGNFRITGILEA